MPVLAEVILPLAVKSNFDYLVPKKWEKEATVGMRVLVVFGKKKIYTGVIKSLREVEDIHAVHKVKPIDEILDDKAMLYPAQLALYEWVAFYYFCTEGEVLKAALPTGLKPESSLVIYPVPEEEWHNIPLDEKELDLLDELKVVPSIPLAEVAALWGVQNPITRLKKMEVKGLVRLIYKVQHKFKPKKVKYIELAEAFHQEEALAEAFEQLARAPAQEEVLMWVVAAWYQNPAPKPKAELIRELGKNRNAPLRALLEKGILIQSEREEGREINVDYEQKETEIELTQSQQNALKKISATDSSIPVLLHGVTGSGKTFVYIELIKKCLQEGRQALYLLPEIALTQQIIDKLKTAFGKQVGVYHSRFSDTDRVEIWQKLISGEYKIVIGVRSAIFLPFNNLGLIVVDESHDASYKQSEPNPRYNARDLAIYYARQENARVVLGTATPALESYFNAQQGKYELVEMKTRAEAAILPEIELVDMREQYRKKLTNHFFSKPLLEAITQTLQKGEQIILFQNRRGYSPFLKCLSCGTVPYCINCDISLTFHKSKGLLRCHYCGYTDHQTSKCDYCGHFELKEQGFGTEQIEEQIKRIFPEAGVSRMDLDTTRSRTGFLKIIRQFERHEADILVGTQMVSKGLDFENVTLVGVVDADLQLNIADFRAYERAYQLLTQVSGRAGRRKKSGKVIVQTWQPDNLVLNLLQKDYSIFFDQMLPIRKQLHYPPYTRLVRIELQHKNQLFLEKEAESIRKIFVASFGSAFLGPEYPPVNRIRGIYRQQGLLKLNRKVSVSAIRKHFHKMLDFYYENAVKKNLRILIDIDPY